MPPVAERNLQPEDLLDVVQVGILPGCREGGEELKYDI